MMRWIALLALCVSQLAIAAPSRPDFHRLVYELHQQQVANRDVRTEEKSGVYNGTAAEGFGYRITRYYDVKTGRLLSRIQRDAGAPEAIHISEVNVFDAEGRLVRDYLSIAPPWNPTYPSNAYLNLHHYPGTLHSFRQFELDGQVNYEFCEGELDGKPVHIALPWEDINREVTATAEYKACFDTMNPDWKPFLTPQ